MDSSQILYLAATAGLMVVLTIGWRMARAQRLRLMATERVEPGTTPDLEKVESAYTEDAEAAVFRAELEPPLEASPVTTGNGEPKHTAAPSAAITERDYKGFRISVREKQPGLWIAAVTGPRGRKRPDRTADISTREFYQMPAALAEAKAIIDSMGRSLAPRH